jgi:hypothetical protein
LENNGKWNTLLISDINPDVVKSLDITAIANHVVLIDNFELKNHFVNLGFVLMNEEKDIVVLKK